MADSIDPEEKKPSGASEEPSGTHDGKKKTKSTALGALLGLCCCVGVAAGFAAYPSVYGTPQQAEEKPAEQEEERTEPQGQSELAISIEAQGWTESDGDVKVRILDAGGAEIAQVRVSPDGGKIALDPGIYMLECTEIPMLADGTVFGIPEPVAIDATADAQAKIVLTPVDENDSAAADEAIEALPEQQRAQARERLAGADQEQGGQQAAHEQQTEAPKQTTDAGTSQDQTDERHSHTRVWSDGEYHVDILGYRCDTCGKLSSSEKDAEAHLAGSDGKCEGYTVETQIVCDKEPGYYCSECGARIS